MKTKSGFILSVVGLLVFGSLKAQDTDAKKGYHMKGNGREIEANFLSSYYEQDGNNGAVTGGIGTEKLNDISNVVIINIPLDSVNSVSLYGGADYYSSASTDNIDNVTSSASSSDVRGFGTLSYSRKNLNRNETYSVHVGYSGEYDYTSINGGLSYTKEWNEGNSEVNVRGQLFVDQWKLIYPVELRGTELLTSRDRRSYNGQLNFSQVLNKRMQMSISGEFVYMTGLLSTPFHRVYFADAASPDIERLPDNRLKVPLGLRFNIYPFQNVVLRTYYRYYWDDFGITANTLELEVPVKLGSAFTVSPFYRYHAQTAADYFAPYQQHLTSDIFYTSDYDLSGLTSHKYGLGLRFSPIYGLARSKPFLPSRRMFMIKYIESRGGYYKRSTGLTAFFISLNVGFAVK